MSIGYPNQNGGRTTDSALFHSFGNIFKGSWVSGFKVRQSSPLGMSVLVGGETGTPDDLLLRGANDAVFPVCNLSSQPVTATISTANSANPRIDTVVVYIDSAVTASQSISDNQNRTKVGVVAGTPATNPSAPSGSQIKAAIGSNSPYVVLANVRVNAGVTSISNTNITDRRDAVLLARDVVLSNSNQLASGIINSGHLANGIVLPRHISKTAWPAFRAVANAPQSFANSMFTQIMFHSEEYDTTNSFSNGTFTAPVSGIYRFDVILALNVPQGVRSIARFVIGNNDKNRFYDGQSAATAGLVMSGSVEVTMTTGQTAKVEAWKAGGDGTQAGNSLSSFSGRLVLPT